MRLLLLISIAACNTTDPTDIAGSYSGNAIFTVSPSTGSGSVGAGQGFVEIDNTVDGVGVTLGPGCMLTATQIEELTFYDNGGDNRFAFTSEAVDSNQTCALTIGGGDLAFSVLEGDLVVEHGLTLSLDIGGTITAAPDPDAIDGYAVYQFAGAQL